MITLDLARHVLACTDDANWREACALVPELEALADEARLCLSWDKATARGPNRVADTLKDLYPDQ